MLFFVAASLKNEPGTSDDRLASPRNCWQNLESFEPPATSVLVDSFGLEPPGLRPVLVASTETEDGGRGSGPNTFAVFIVCMAKSRLGEW